MVKVVNVSIFSCFFCLPNDNNRGKGAYGSLKDASSHYILNVPVETVFKRIETPAVNDLFQQTVPLIDNS